MARGDDAMLGEVPALFAELFGVDPGSVTATTGADDVDGWDSMGHLVLIQTVEERYRITLEMKEMFEIVDAESLATVLVRHGVAAHA